MPTSALDFSLGKAALRKQAKVLRDALPDAERKQVDGLIARHLLASPVLQAAPRVFAYVSFGSEVDTCEVLHSLWQQGRVVLLPRCVKGSRNLAWYVVGGEDQLKPGAYGILEPNPEACLRWDGVGRSGDVALVPGLVFDRQGYRVGYGGGYYDCFLPTFGGCTIGLCRSAFVSSTPLPYEQLDVPVMEVCTEGGFLSHL